VVTFWQQIDAQLDRIETEKPDTFDGVRAILLDTQYAAVVDDVNLNGVRTFGPDAAFFAGSGGDRSLWGALHTAGWARVWSGASYYYMVQHPITAETLTYCEGDVLRGDAR
jgi:hypothetical protein